MPLVKVSKDSKGFRAGTGRQEVHAWGFNYDRDDQGRLLEDY
jgi:hypothetical protein